MAITNNETLVSGNDAARGAATILNRPSMENFFQMAIADKQRKEAAAQKSKEKAQKELMGKLPEWQETWKGAYQDKYNEMFYGYVDELTKRAKSNYEKYGSYDLRPDDLSEFAKRESYMNAFAAKGNQTKEEHSKLAAEFAAHPELYEDVSKENLDKYLDPDSTITASEVLIRKPKAVKLSPVTIATSTSFIPSLNQTDENIIQTDRNVTSYDPKSVSDAYFATTYKADDPTDAMTQLTMQTNSAIDELTKEDGTNPYIVDGEYDYDSYTYNLKQGKEKVDSSKYPLVKQASSLITAKTGTTGNQTVSQKRQDGSGDEEKPYTRDAAYGDKTIVTSTDEEGNKITKDVPLLTITLAKKGEDTKPFIYNYTGKTWSTADGGWKDNVGVKTTLENPTIEYRAVKDGDKMKTGLWLVGEKDMIPLDNNGAASVRESYKMSEDDFKDLIIKSFQEKHPDFNPNLYDLKIVNGEGGIITVKRYKKKGVPDSAYQDNTNNNSNTGGAY